MKFRLEQAYNADADAVSDAYADPGLYEAFSALPRAGRPEVLRHVVKDDTVNLEVRWAFTAPLSAAARAVIDPERLTWVQRSVHDLSSRTVRYEMLPDHYADRFSCRGTYRFSEAGGGRSSRTSEGELKIKAPLVAKAVEGAIIEGLDEQLHAEVPVVEAYLRSLGS